MLVCSAAAYAQECLHTYVCISYLSLCGFIVCVCVCLQVQHELSQKTEKLHGEVAQKQQLSEEFEQVAAIIDAFFFLCVCIRAENEYKLSG